MKMERRRREEGHGENMERTWIEDEEKIGKRREKRSEGGSEDIKREGATRGRARNQMVG